jgi:hypothetical protein
MRSMRLSRNEKRLSSFWLEGQLGGSHVFALWDGEVLTATDRLVALAELAEQVDRALVESGLESERRSCSLSGTADRALLTLIWLCDELESVEFTDSGGSWKAV